MLKTIENMSKVENYRYLLNKSQIHIYIFKKKKIN